MEEGRITSALRRMRARRNAGQANTQEVEQEANTQEANAANKAVATSTEISSANISFGQASSLADVARWVPSFPTPEAWRTVGEIMAAADAALGAHPEDNTERESNEQQDSSWMSRDGVNIPIVDIPLSAYSSEDLQGIGSIWAGQPGVGQSHVMIGRSHAAGEQFLAIIDRESNGRHDTLEVVDLDIRDDLGSLIAPLPQRQTGNYLEGLAILSELLNCQDDADGLRWFGRHAEMCWRHWPGLLLLGNLMRFEDDGCDYFDRDPDLRSRDWTHLIFQPRRFCQQSWVVAVGKILKIIREHRDARPGDIRHAREFTAVYNLWQNFIRLDNAEMFCDFNSVMRRYRRAGYDNEAAHIMRRVRIIMDLLVQGELDQL